MKKIIFPAIALMMAACAQSPVEKANALLSDYPIDFGMASKLDSVYDYPRALQFRTMADSVTLLAEHQLEALIDTLSYHKANGTLGEIQDYGEMMKNGIVAMHKKALSFQNEATFIVFDKSISQEQKEFVGYSFISTNDTCEYTVYLNPSITAIIGFERTSRKK